MLPPPPFAPASSPARGAPDMNALATSPPPTLTSLAHHRAQTSAPGQQSSNEEHLLTLVKDDLPATSPFTIQTPSSSVSNRARVPIRPSASTPSLAPYELSHGKRRKSNIINDHFPVNLEFKPPRGESVFPLQGIKVIVGKPKRHCSGGLLSSRPRTVVAKQHARALSVDSYLADRAFKEVVVDSHEEVDGVLGRTSYFDNLPSEIHETILDYVLGINCGNRRSRGGSVSREWNVRHLRTSRLSSLALVCPKWRKIIQSRLYRHLKVKGTVAAVQDCRNWFMKHDHLRHHVRHFEVWFPVWEKSALASPSDRFQNPSLPSPLRVFTPASPLYPRRTATGSDHQLSSRNATLSMVLNMVDRWFPGTYTLTIEGGDCKNARMITYSEHRMEDLPVLRSVQRLLIKGTWNVMRSRRDAEVLFRCFPELRDWHCAFAMARIEAYGTLSRAMPLLPPRLSCLNLSLESFYSSSGTPLTNSDDSSSGHLHTHLCESLGSAMCQIQELTYTGTLCASFFIAAVEAARDSRDGSMLTKLDLTVKNCCRPLILDQSDSAKLCEGDETDEEGEAAEAQALKEGIPHLGAWGQHQAGVTNQPFMIAFLKLVVSCVRSLGTLERLEQVRIRFVDLDAPTPFLNPYWRLSRPSQITDGLPQTLIFPSASFVDTFRPAYLPPHLNPLVPSSARYDRPLVASGVWLPALGEILKSVRRSPSCNYSFSAAEDDDREGEIHYLTLTDGLAGLQRGNVLSGPYKIETLPRSKPLCIWWSSYKALWG